MTGQPERLVVIGGSLAGLRAVEGARSAGHTGEIVLIGAEEHLPYNRPPLSKEVLVPGQPPPDTSLCSREHLDDVAVTLRLGAPATALDPLATGDA